MQNTILSYLPNAFQHDMESVEILGESSWKAVIHTECDSSPFLPILDPLHLTTSKAMAIVMEVKYEYYENCLYCRCATSSIGSVNKKTVHTDQLGL